MNIHKLIENKSWHVVPSWWSIIEPKIISQIYSSDIHWGKSRKTCTVVMSSYPVVPYFPLIVPYLSPLTELPTDAFNWTFYLLPSTSRQVTPTVRAKWKTAIFLLLTWTVRIIYFEYREAADSLRVLGPGRGSSSNREANTKGWLTKLHVFLKNILSSNNAGCAL